MIISKSVENEKGCFLWVGGSTASKNLRYGQKRLSVPHLNIKSRVFYVHRLAYMLKNECFDLPGTSSRGAGPKEVSHLCHNSLCVNPDHLVAETHAANVERLSCHALGHCIRTHEPPCIV